MGLSKTEQDTNSYSNESDHIDVFDLQESVVFIVDDDAQSRRSVCALVNSMGIKARSYESAEEFLAAYRGQSGCLITDVRMLGMSGVELQRRLKQDGIRLPVVIVSAFAKAKMVLQAIKNGAIDFLDKPYSDDELWQAIQHALNTGRRWRRTADRASRIRSRMFQLSENERVVLDHIVAGLPNKKIASVLKVSLRTVENRRQQVFTKMQASSVAELVRCVLEAEYLDRE